jgi:hypothetical protein
MSAITGKTILLNQTEILYRIFKGRYSATQALYELESKGG